MVFRTGMASMGIDKTPVDECPECGEQAYDHVESGERYEGSPIGRIRVCVTEKGAFFHSWKQVDDL
ncbi:hypothetical protein [Haloplanus sp. C73]|uniref:hypothetical protein n=1 Tax=Haloplanus sp. C73 TaxID=3421641 RepID=UPI003EBF3CC6